YLSRLIIQTAFFKSTRNYKEKSSDLMCYFYKSYVTKLLVKKRFL
ncbi:hypothetical protein D353_00142, partial [Enterococcus faecium OC2A-1]